MSEAKVAIMCGSDSDLPVLQRATRTLDSFDVGYELNVLSAHRTPQDVDDYLKSIEGGSVQVLICAAGMAAHLAGAVAARTTLPVIGLPIASPPFEGLDSMLSTVQMPPGIPVLTVTAGTAGGTNAALAAVQILALSDEGLRKKLKRHRADMAASIKQKNEKLKSVGIDDYVRDQNAAG